MVKIKKTRIALISAMITAGVYFYFRAPIVVGDWTKQTYFLWFLDSFHGQSSNAKPRILLVDDDSGEGIYSLKSICDELHIKATFAVVPGSMNKQICDSLRNWQKQGFGIAIHSFSHDNWREWSYNEVLADIEKCEKQLAKWGFNIHNIRYVVAPHSSNNRKIREAIRDKNYQMITGANIINPDTTPFLLGRMLISDKTNLADAKNILKKAKKRNCFVIFGTHSSMTDNYSEKKTKAILKMAIDIGFEN